MIIIQTYTHRMIHLHIGITMKTKLVPEHCFLHLHAVYGYEMKYRDSYPKCNAIVMKYGGKWHQNIGIL